MEYRKLPHGNEEISVLGFGTSAIGEASEKKLLLLFKWQLKMALIILI